MSLQNPKKAEKEKVIWVVECDHDIRDPQAYSTNGAATHELRSLRLNDPSCNARLVPYVRRVGK